MWSKRFLPSAATKNVTWKGSGDAIWLVRRRVPWCDGGVLVKRVAFPLALRLFLAPTFCHLALETLSTSDPYPPFNLLLLFLSFSSLSSPRRLQTCPSLQPTCKKCVFFFFSPSTTGARARAVARQRTRARISSFQPSEAPHELPLRLPPPQSAARCRASRSPVC